MTRQMGSCNDTPAHMHTFPLDASLRVYYLYIAAILLALLIYLTFSPNRYHVHINNEFISVSKGCPKLPEAFREQEDSKSFDICLYCTIRQSYAIRVNWGLGVVHVRGGVVATSQRNVQYKKQLRETTNFGSSMMSLLSFGS
ncbi:hypothetical protein EJ08DRAFT_24076 [Tothia fuscella]|uniref:Uncharacterized protein n=1 Tax=Tothia fuscella TaxID=1048955 RepID=A0A9P4U0Z3_9PEZI|nr:hypothetical protein EJ08DRAFT_24076 [Tothia fuscella]